MQSIIYIWGYNHDTTNKKSITLYLHPYNLLYTNDWGTIRSTVAPFAQERPLWSAKTICLSRLLPVATYLFATAQPLPAYYQLFKKVDPSGKLTVLANYLVTAAKKELAPGAHMLQLLLDAGHDIRIITKQTPAVLQAWQQKFPLLQRCQFHPVDDINKPMPQKDKHNIYLVTPNVKQARREHAASAGFTCVEIDPTWSDEAILAALTQARA